MALKTVRGQQIALYPASPPVQTEKKEYGRTYRLCQILPASPQRFEWVRIDNILEIPREERDRLRRTPLVRWSGRSSKLECRIENPAQEQSQDREAA